MVRFLVGAALFLALGACAPTTAPSADVRPRHRVDETAEESKRLVEPWQACVKDRGADACLDKLPRPPWGMDRANPAYRDNVRKWVQCMNDRGMRVAETPDNGESPWTSTSDNQPPDSDKIEHDCEVEILGPSDK